MITNFVTVYPGHIDFPDHGQGATPANERRFTNAQLATVYEKTEAVAKKLDDIGFHSLWMAEHHFQHEGYETLAGVNFVSLEGIQMLVDTAVGMLEELAKIEGVNGNSASNHK